MHNQQGLIDVNIKALEEGLQLLSMLNLSDYKQGFKPAFQSDIGTHFRHVLEHYRCFFEQIPKTEFRYDQRPRDGRLESDLMYAKQTILDLINLLCAFDMSLFEHDYTVTEEQSENGGKGMLIDGVKTTLERELMFLQSHTVHHYAMIAAMTRALGLNPDAEFGVAIPTRNYTRDLDHPKATSLSKMKSVCVR